MDFSRYIVCMKYIDAHCHLGGTQCGDCAGFAPVVGFVFNSAGRADWGAVTDMVAHCRCAYACVGLHPWNIADATDGWDTELHDILIRHPEFMVGEIGLDRARPDFSAQEQVFLRQFDMAAQLRRGVQIHCVRAWDKMLQIFAAHAMPPVVIAHSFRGGAEIINAAMRHANIYFSYSDATGARERESIAAAPIDRILIESDSTPSESITKLPQIALEIAKIKSIGHNEMADILYNNTLRMITDGQAA